MGLSRDYLGDIWGEFMKWYYGFILYIGIPVNQSPGFNFQ